MLRAFYKSFPPLPFSVTPFLHTPRSFAIGRRSGGSESPSFTWGFLWQRELKGSSFQSLHARKDVLPASWGAKLILDASAARRGALAAQVPDLWSGSRATSCAASLVGSWGAFPFPLMSVQVLADVGRRIALLIRRFQYLSEKNFHGKSWAINLATNHNISLLLIYSITQTLTFVISLTISLDLWYRALAGERIWSHTYFHALTSVNYEPSDSAFRTQDAISNNFVGKNGVPGQKGSLITGCKHDSGRTVAAFCSASGVAVWPWGSRFTVVLLFQFCIGKIRTVIITFICKTL